MKVLIIPLTSSRTLVFCSKLQENKPLSIFERITEKAATTWKNWETKESWFFKKTTSLGNNILGSIPYNEWSLKSFPSKETIPERVKILYAPKFTPAHSVLDPVLKNLANFSPYHLKWSIMNAFGIPLMLPVGIIPIIPNLPLYFFAFRAYSHWRAWRGSECIKSILDNKKYVLEESVELQDLLSKSQQSPFKLNSVTAQEIAKAFDISHIELETERALKQIEKIEKLKEKGV